MNSVQNISAFLALPLAPLVSDSLGRRQGIFIGAVLILGGTALQSQATSIAMFIISRGMSTSYDPFLIPLRSAEPASDNIVGFGLSFSVNSAPLLITELSYPTQRGTLTAM